MKKFKKRINIDNATAFKLEYKDGNHEIKEKEFTSYDVLLKKAPITWVFRQGMN